LAQVAPSNELKKMFKTNSKKLADYVEIFPATFVKEGEYCLCDDGKAGNCKRFIWNCQWTIYIKSKTFCAQRNRCIIGSRTIYTETNSIFNPINNANVINELEKGWRCNLSKCHKRFNTRNPADIDGRFMSNPNDVETRFCNDAHFKEYLKEMKETNEKVSFHKSKET
jgi:hypothetical protein